MGIRELFLGFGFSEEETERMIREGVPQYQANVAYSESIRDLNRMESADDFRD